MSNTLISALQYIRNRVLGARDCASFPIVGLPLSPQMVPTSLSAVRSTHTHTCYASAIRSLIQDAVWKLPVVRSLLLVGKAWSGPLYLVRFVDSGLWLFCGLICLGNLALCPVWKFEGMFFCSPVSCGEVRRLFFPVRWFASRGALFVVLFASSFLVI